MAKIAQYHVSGKIRYKIVDSENPEVVISDAQGYGFSSVEKALAFFNRQKTVLGEHHVETPPDYRVFTSSALF